MMQNCYKAQNSLSRVRVGGIEEVNEFAKAWADEAPLVAALRGGVGVAIVSIRSPKATLNKCNDKNKLQDKSLSPPFDQIATPKSLLHMNSGTATGHHDSPSC